MRSVKHTLWAALLAFGGHFAPAATAQDLAMTDREPMTQAACRTSWQGIADGLKLRDGLRNARPEVTPVGNCALHTGNADLKAKDFTSLTWWADGIEAAVRNQGVPRALDIAFGGIDLREGFNLPLPSDAGPALASLRIKGMHAPQRGPFELEMLHLDAVDLGNLRVSISGDGVDLTSAERLQLSLGGLRVRRITLQLDADPKLLSAVMQATKADKSLSDWPKVLEAMPSETFTANSRATLVAFARSLPSASGTLDLELRSDSGLGFLQIISGASALRNANDDPDKVSDALAQMLNGVRVDVNWSAGR